MEEFTVTFIDLTEEFTIGTISTLTEAPVDGNQYARKDAGWSQLVGTGGDMTKSIYDPNTKNADAFDYANFEGVANVLSLNTAASESVAQGQFAWNSDEETFDFGLNGAVLQGGQEVHYHVRNNSGALISDGTAVMASGTIGSSGRITIAKMDGSDIANAKLFLGITTEDIADGTDGKVTFFGKVRGLNTSVWSEGDVLWVDNAVLGGLTNTQPTTNTRLPIAFVITVSATVGTIAVRSTDGTYLNESHDTSIVNPINGNSLVYDGNKWVNQTLPGEANTIDSEPIGNEAQVLQVVSISQANYDLITPVATTFYIIT